MPLRGGDADKVGNRYELRWTVCCMADVMRERAQSIRLEPPGAEWEGAEFWLRVGDVHEYHQVKRQQARGSWKLAHLEEKKVLSNFWRKLASDPAARCVFVSTDRAFQMDELAYRARSAASWEEYRDNFLNSKASSDALTELCRYWDDCTFEEAYEALRRVYVKTIDEDTLNTMLESALETLVEGDPSTVYAQLMKLALDNVHHELTAIDIWHYLSSVELRRREWGKNPHVLATIDALNHVYIAGLRETIIDQHLIPREETIAALQVFAAASSAPLAQSVSSASSSSSISNISESGGVDDAAGNDNTGPDGGPDAGAIGKQAEGTKRAVLISGEAGIGKSSVLLAIVEALQSAGWPVLALRVDRLTPVHLPDQVGHSLGLPGSPANVLASVAQRRPCVLVIDQLDAVSIASGRNTNFFDCIHLIIKQALTHPNMCLLLACRKFDLDNDSRLRRLTGQEGVAQNVPVARLSRNTVREVVAKSPLNADSLSDKQLDLLSVPLHLRLLMEVAEDHTVDALDFKTAKDLYDRFWSHKRRVLNTRLGRTVQWTQVVDALCDYMSSEQVLHAPRERVDQYEEDAEAMASEHILTKDQNGSGNRYMFFHEGFFDYAFARRFSDRGRNLTSLLHSGEGEQHLFRRAQVRQVLVYQRDADPERYCTELRAVLTDPKVRFHIKGVVFGLLSGLTEPTPGEWQVLSALISGTDELLAVGAWNVLLRSVPWFDLLDKQGAIERWLAASDELLLRRVTVLLSLVQKERAERIAQLLEPYADVEAAPGYSDSQGPRDRLVYIMQWANFSASRRFFDMFLRLIDNGVLDDARGPIAVNSDFWTLIYELPDERPDWACEVIGHYLNRRQHLRSATSKEPDVNIFVYDWALRSGVGDDVLLKSARGAPAVFVQEVLPFMLSVIEQTARPDTDPPYQDTIWSHGPYGSPLDVASAVLAGMEEALSLLAVNDPETFATIVERLREYRYDTVHYLLVRAYTAGRHAFADEAAEYLCAVPDRLHTGYGGARDERYWAARELIGAISPHCSSANLSRLEEVILSYYPQRERRKVGQYAFGRAQLVLLQAIDPARRSRLVIRRLEELHRKFVDWEVEPPDPQGVQFFRVTSPIPADKADKMSDQHWLKAIKNYPSSRRGKNGGSAPQLSSLLSQCVRREPERFANLMLQFPDDTDPHYFGAVLAGLSDSGYDTETVIRLCQHCHELPNKPCGQNIARAIANMADRPLSEEALGLVAWYATEGDEYARTTAADAIAELVGRDGVRITYFRATLENMVEQPSVHVRHTVAWALRAVLAHDEDLAVSLFLRLCEAGDADSVRDIRQAVDTPDCKYMENRRDGDAGGAERGANREDELLNDSYIEAFLLEAVESHFHALKPLLERMVASNTAEVARIGARVASKASVIYEEAQPLTSACVRGTEVQQKAAAEALAANVSMKQQRQFCEKSLVQLFNSEYEGVRAQAATCFNHLWGEGLEDRASLVDAFIDSRSFDGEQGYLIHALEETTSNLSELAYRVCKRFFEVVGPAAGDISSRGATGARKVVQLVVRVYGYALESRDAALQANCLDLIDQAAAYSAYGLEEALAPYER